MNEAYFLLKNLMGKCQMRIDHHLKLAKILTKPEL